MNETERIIGELRRAMHGDPWHGSSLAGILDGVDATRAAARPMPGAHTIWEIVLHLTGWAREVGRRVRGEAPGEPAAGDWPKVTDTTPEAWQAALDDLRAAHEELFGALASFPDARLDQTMGGDRDRALGTGVTWEQTLHGTAQHDAYHAGQIALLKKMTTGNELEQAFHRRFAAQLFNRTWELLDKQDRTAEEAMEMLHAAHASRSHWGKIGAPVNLARGEWQVSRVYAVLGRGEAALVHARRCLEICQANAIGDFDLAFAYEALARAHAVSGEIEQCRRNLKLARIAAEQIDGEEDRKLLLDDLATVPGGSDPA